MENKTYLVLTPEKIEDIFRDLKDNFTSFKLWEAEDKQKYIQNILDAKKQELLKSIK